MSSWRPYILGGLSLGMLYIALNDIGWLQGRIWYYGFALAALSALGGPGFVIVSESLRREAQKRREK